MPRVLRSRILATQASGTSMTMMAPVNANSQTSAPRGLRHREKAQEDGIKGELKKMNKSKTNDKSTEEPAMQVDSVSTQSVGVANRRPLRSCRIKKLHYDEMNSNQERVQKKRAQRMPKPRKPTSKNKEAERPASPLRDRFGGPVIVLPKTGAKRKRMTPEDSELSSLSSPPQSDDTKESQLHAKKRVKLMVNTSKRPIPSPRVPSAVSVSEHNDTVTPTPMKRVLLVVQEPSKVCAPDSFRKNRDAVRAAADRKNDSYYESDIEHGTTPVKGVCKRLVNQEKRQSSESDKECASSASTDGALADVSSNESDEEDRPAVGTSLALEAPEIATRVKQEAERVDLSALLPPIASYTQVRQEAQQQESEVSDYKTQKLEDIDDDDDSLKLRYPDEF